jgi:hypothetical protein
MVQRLRLGGGMSCRYCTQYTLERYKRRSKLRDLVMGRCEC